MITNFHNPSDKRIYTERWPVMRGKKLFRVMDERSTEGTEELLSVSHITGITPRTQKNVTMFKSESLVGYKICEKGDIAANTMWTWQGAIGVSEHSGVVSPAYIVYRQKDNYYHPRYLDMMLREKYLVDVYRSISTGIRPSRLRLYPDPFLGIYFPVPPMDEQIKMVNYLDWKLSKINKVISSKRKEISLLLEQRQRLIDDTLFAKCEKGDGEGETNPLGLVLPKDWQIIKFNGFFNFGKGLNITKKDLQEEGIAVISYGQVHSKTNMGTEINDTLIRYVDESYVQTSPKALVNKGDFTFADTSEDFAGVGNCVFVDRDDTIFAGYHTLIARPKDGKEHRYLAYLFKSSLWRYQVRKKVNGVKVYSITQKILKNALIFLPPVPEQEEVIMFLDDKCKMLSCAIEQITREITSLQEMKKRLISDVVTGKIDVREIDIPEYSISLDDIDADMDDEYMEDEIDEEV